MYTADSLFSPFTGKCAGRGKKNREMNDQAQTVQNAGLRQYTGLGRRDGGGWGKQITPNRHYGHRCYFYIAPWDGVFMYVI